MGATEQVVERESVRSEEREENVEKEEQRVKDLEKGERGFEEKVVERNNNFDEFQLSRLQRLNPSNPLRVALNASTRVATPSPSQFASTRVATPSPSQFSQASQPRSTPTPQQSLITLNSTRYTNKISLFLFLLHMVVAVGLVCFLIFKGVQGFIQASDSVKRTEKRLLQFFLPQVEAASLLSITLAFTWQKAVREWPRFMVPFILWSTFIMTLSAGILLICFQKPATDGVGVCFIFFAIGSGLYACWVTPRIKFCSKVLIKALEPVSKFHDLNQPTYWMLGAGFVWMSLWILAVIGALNFYFPPLIIVLLFLSLAWTTEVMRNIANLTLLYYHHFSVSMAFHWSLISHKRKFMNWRWLSRIGLRIRGSFQIWIWREKMNVGSA